MMNFEQFVNSLTEEQKNALMSALSTKPNNAEPQQEIEKKQIQNSPRRVVGEDFKITSTREENFRGKIPVRAKKNEWQDNYEEHRDIYTPKIDRTPRNREKSKKVEIECHICGKTFYIDPRFVYGEYQRCNRCTGK